MKKAMMLTVFLIMILIACGGNDQPDKDKAKAAIAAANYNKYELAANELGTISTALASYYLKSGEYPSGDYTSMLVSLEGVFIYEDPWDNPYGYKKKDGNFELWSAGPDGVYQGVSNESDDLIMKDGIFIHLPERERPAPEYLGAKEAKLYTIRDLSGFSSALDKYKKDHSKYPMGDFEDMKDALVPKYMKKIYERDFWGTDYYYFSEDGREYILASGGPDKKIEMGKKSDDLILINGKDQ